jgi:hypothetical protein
MSRFHAAALATVLLLPAALHAQPQDCGSIIAREQMLFPIAGSSLGGPDIDPGLAPTVVNAHIVDGRIGADQLRPGGFLVGARPAHAPIVQADIGCTNGVVHKIDHVLVR